MRSLATLCNTFERLCDALLRSYMYENFEKFAFYRCAEVCVRQGNSCVTVGQSRPYFAQDSQTAIVELKSRLPLVFTFTLKFTVFD